MALFSSLRQNIDAAGSENYSVSEIFSLAQCYILGEECFKTLKNLNDFQFPGNLQTGWLYRTLQDTQEADQDKKLFF